MKHLWLPVVLCTASSTLATLKETEEGKLVDDFEDALLSSWVFQRQRPVQIIQKEGNNLLYVGGPGSLEPTRIFRIVLRERTFEDFAVQVKLNKLRGSWAGVVVRGNYEVLINQEGKVFVRRLPSGVLKYGKRRYKNRKFHTVRVVCAGPLIRVFVDSNLEAELHDAEVHKGGVALTVHYAEVYFDDFSLSTKIRAIEALLIKPAPAEGALVFAPDKDIQFPLNISNSPGNP